MLNTMTENENEYHDLWPRPQGQNGNISETFAFIFRRIVSNMMKFIVKTFM